ncbi:hypothetical protein OQA88_5283 [Cercophora sp. LCS_1]
MQRDNTSDRFKDVQSRALDYPKTLLRSTRPHEIHNIDVYCKRLKQSKENIFKAEESMVEIWETTKPNRFQLSEYTRLDQVRDHLDLRCKDPEIRHVFFESGNSRSPIDCSLEVFTAISTYQQIEPSFLDAVFTFGEQEEPKDLCLMSFSSGHTLSAPKDKLIQIPGLGRSGRGIHVSYLLRSIEAKGKRDWPWQIRQAAVYHSFDTETGKTFWLTIKGNDRLSSRIRQSSSYLELPPSASQSDDPVTYFKASLATHLIYISWCDENWRQCINELEADIQKILDSARNAPIDDDIPDKAIKLATYPRYQRRDSRRNTLNSRAGTGLTEPGPLVRKQSTFETIRSASLALVSQTKLFSKQKPDDVEMANCTAPGIDENPSVEALVDTRVILDKFRFSHVQTLHTFSDRIRRYILTVKLNVSVLGELSSFYHNLLVSDTATFKPVRDGCKHDLVDFLAEVKAIATSLETRLAQLECLAAMLAEGIVLYDGILQHRQLDIARRFQETARESAEQMQIIANKTKLETASMHVITVVTLLFLPGTFVAAHHLLSQTFFQSGAILWAEAPENMDETYKYSGDGLKLFATFSIPVMAITVGIWLVVYLTKRHRLNREMRLADLEREKGR